MRNEAGLIPTGTRIIVRPQKMETATKGGIVLVDTTREAEERAATRGVLVDAGADAFAVKEMKGIEIGDVIFFARYAGDAINFARDGTLYRVMDGRDVLGKIEAEFDSRFQAARTPAEVGQVHAEVPA